MSSTDDAGQGATPSAGPSAGPSDGAGKAGAGKAASASDARDLSRPDQALDAIGAAALRLMAGAVPKPRLEQLRRTVEQSPNEFPWQVVTQAILAEPVDPQRLVQQGLAAQRDWIVRGGRTAPGPSITRRAKGFFARLTAQLIFGVIFAVVVVLVLLILKYKLPDFDIYRILEWFRGLIGR